MSIISYISIPFGYLMKWFYSFVGNYGIAIILFAVAAKIILLPFGIWIQKNSIAMVKIQPEVNFLKARLSGNQDAIAEEQSKLYKKEHYHPALSLIPLILQLFMIIVVIEIIYHPLTYIFGFSNDFIKTVAEGSGLSTSAASYQLNVLKFIKDGGITASSVIEGVDPQKLARLIEKTNSFKFNFLGANLLNVPTKEWGLYMIAPVLTGLSSVLMTVVQNKEDVLQREQGKINKISVMTITIGVSFYFGLFLPSGIAVYWVAGNILSVIQTFSLNAVINPKKYVDYEALEKSRQALDEAKNFGKIDKNDPKYRELLKREKADYAKFKKVANKHVVFYSEKSGFYKHFKGVIAELLKNSNLNIHYVTNDPDDIIFKEAVKEPRIRPYFISLKKMVSLMMLVETDMFIMTTPDLDKMYLKRSLIKKDTEYVYMPHGVIATRLEYNEGAFDAFDTVFCVGEHIKEEHRAIEKAYNLKEKKMVEFGYPLADELVKAGKEANAIRETMPKDRRKEILIAPSWVEDNLLDSCVDGLIENLYCDKYHITVRPHPEYVKRFKDKMQAIVDRYKDRDENLLTFELDFSKNKSIYTSDVIITDWSAVGTEFCFATGRPAIYINTKMKCLNPNWQKVDNEPVTFKLRNEIGIALEKSEVDKIAEKVEYLFTHATDYKNAIDQAYDKYVYNHGCAVKAGAKYILYSLAKKERERNKK